MFELESGGSAVDKSCMKERAFLCGFTYKYLNVSLWNWALIYFIKLQHTSHTIFSPFSLCGWDDEATFGGVTLSQRNIPPSHLHLAVAHLEAGVGKHCLFTCTGKVSGSSPCPILMPPDTLCASFLLSSPPPSGLLLALRNSSICFN